MAVKRWGAVGISNMRRSVLHQFEATNEVSNFGIVWSWSISMSLRLLSSSCIVVCINSIQYLSCKPRIVDSGWR